MSRLLEILGRAIAIDTADLIWHWLDAVKHLITSDEQSARMQRLDKIVESASQDSTKTKTALGQLKLYLFENPSCIYGRLAAAAACLQQNRLEAALEQLNSVYLRQPSNTMALYALGHCYERLGKEAEAIEFYQDCLKFKNFLQLPRQRLAAIYFKNNQTEKTIHEYELLKEEYPDDISTLLTLGYLYIAAGEYIKAADIFNNAILIHPDNFHEGNDDIDQLIAAGRLYEANDHIDHLLAQQPDRPDLVLKKADVLAMLGACDDCIAQYQHAIDLCPGFLEANIKLGTHYLQQGDQQLAARQFNQAAEINDQIVDAYIGLATARKFAGNDADALATLSLAAAIDANTSLLLAETAKLQFAMTALQKDPAQHDSHNSINILDTIIRTHHQQTMLNSHNPELHYRLGILMSGVARTSEAVRAFQAALKINPTYSRARSKLAVSLFETGQTKLALDQLTDADLPDKSALELHYKTALLYCDKVKFASSLINLDHFMQSNFACANSTTNISIVLQNLGLVDRAAVMWDNISDIARQALNTDRRD